MPLIYYLITYLLPYNILLAQQYLNSLRCIYTNITLRY